MSHELRTPLNAVLGFAQMLQYDPTTPPTDRQLIHIQSILEGGDHLLELINEILDLAKIEADQLNISLDTIPADDVIAECISLTTPIGKQRGINIIYENDTGSKTPLYTDRTRLKQCLLNLLSNAIKFNQNDGTVRISARETTDGFLRLCVTDTGIGIAKKDYPNVFQLFHRLNADPMISREGTGIGLTVTKMLIERLAGRIGFESKEGKGSTFWIELPLTTNEEVLIWSDVMRTRIDAIDKDHQAMVSLLNKIAHGSVNKEETAGIVKELVDYTRYHFLREETIMLACDFPNMIEHRASHAAITLKVSEMAFSWVKNREHALLQRFHKTFRDWLSDHIINEDPKIGPYARDKKDEIHDALDKLALAGKNKDDR